MLEKEDESMKRERLTPVEAAQKYEPVDRLVQEQNISRPAACEQLGIVYSSYAAWKHRQSNPKPEKKKRRRRRRKEATVVELPQRTSHSQNNELIIRLAYKIPNLLADLIELEHTPSALKYIADRKDDHLLAIKNAKMALDLLGKSFSERNY